MHRLLHRHARPIAAVILSAFLAAWVLPVQACAGMAAQADCSGCSAPCCQQDCSPDLASACAPSMLPAAAVPASPAKIAPAPALPLDLFPRLTPAQWAFAPPLRPPVYSPSLTLNIRYCRFQE